MNAATSLHPTLDVSDGTGTFRLSLDRSIVVLDGYPNAGQLYRPGGVKYNQVLNALASHGDNRDRMQAFWTSVAPAPSSTIAPRPDDSSASPLEFLDELDEDVVKTAVAVGVGLLVLAVVIWVLRSL